MSCLEKGFGVCAFVLVSALALLISIYCGILPGGYSDLASASPDSGWEQQSALPFLNDLWSVDAVDADTAWAVGYYGTILKTVDGGTTWTAQTPGTTGHLYDISAVNNDIAWAVGSGSTVLKTVDGGTTWTDQTSAATWLLNDVAAVDADTAWAVGSNGAIIKTTDGGTTWTAQTSGTTLYLSDIRALDADIVWVVGGDSGHSVILKTTDGGTTWISQDLGTTQSLYLRSISVLDADTAWTVASDGTTLKTTDGGTTWTVQASSTTQYIYSISALDADTAWTVSSTGTIFKTADGAETWHAWDSGIGYFLRDIAALDGGTAWAVGAHGIILKTDDGGTSWTVQSLGIGNLFDVHAVDADIAWAVGEDGAVLKTTDGGEDWEFVPLGTGGSRGSISAVDENTAWMVDGTIHKTSDGGGTWLQQDANIPADWIPSGSESFVVDICALDADTAYAVGNIVFMPHTSVALPVSGFILKTTDGGDTWAPTQILNVNGLASVSAVDADTVWVAGPHLVSINPAYIYSVVLKTTDGGRTWLTQYSGAMNYFNGIDAVDINTLWARLSQVYRTIDGGSSWSLKDPMIAGLQAISAVDELTAWLVGKDGAVLKTVDGGENWDVQDSGVTESISSISAADSSTALAVGLKGLILKTSDGGDGRPDIISVSPSAASPGDEVTITGNDFGDTRELSLVSFGDIQATVYTSWSDTEIVVEVPAGVTGELGIASVEPDQAGQLDVAQYLTIKARDFNVTVTTVEGTSNRAEFRDVSSSGFQPGSTVRLEKGGAVLNAFNVNVLSDDLLTCFVGFFMVEPGVYDVIVENSDGSQAVLEDGLTVTSACGEGSGTALLMLGLTLGLLSLAGSTRMRRKRRRDS